MIKMFFNLRSDILIFFREFISDKEIYRRFKVDREERFQKRSKNFLAHNIL
jgi:hypothetical protein